jgi:hypothetical protein
MSRESLAASSDACRVASDPSYVVETPVLNAVTAEIREVVESVWPELISKLPPRFDRGERN